jgi:predicted metalloendopeptidase
MRDWWTPADLKEFRFRTSRLVAQYNRFEPIKGSTSTASSPWGRTSAISAASPSPTRPTCCRWMAGGPVLDGFTGEQRFFLGWAQVWKACIAPS